MVEVSVEGVTDVGLDLIVSAMVGVAMDGVSVVSLGLVLGLVVGVAVEGVADVGLGLVTYTFSLTSCILSSSFRSGQASSSPILELALLPSVVWNGLQV